MAAYITDTVHSKAGNT